MFRNLRFCYGNNFRDQKSYLNVYHKHFYLVVIVMQHLVGVLLWRWLKETKSRQENWRLVWIKMQYYGFPFGIHQIGHCWDTHVELFQINIYKFILWFWIALCLLLVFIARFSCCHKIVRIMMVWWWISTEIIAVARYFTGNPINEIHIFRNEMRVIHQKVEDFRRFIYRNSDSSLFSLIFLSKIKSNASQKDIILSSHQ